MTFEQTLYITITDGTSMAYQSKLEIMNSFFFLTVHLISKLLIFLFCLFYKRNSCSDASYGVFLATHMMWVTSQCDDRINSISHVSYKLCPFNLLLTYSKIFLQKKLKNFNIMNRSLLYKICTNATLNQYLILLFFFVMESVTSCTTGESFGWN